MNRRALSSGLVWVETKKKNVVNAVVAIRLANPEMRTASTDRGRHKQRRDRKGLKDGLEAVESEN
jgi:hypothetical protein